MSQTERLFKLLSDFRVHDTPEILEKVYGSSHLGIARVSARIWDVQRKYGVRIESKKSEKKSSIWEYQMQRPFNDQTLFDI
jgi:hypothetical protein